MGQGYSLTTLSAGSAGIDVPELADLTYEKSLGMARFLKSIRARHADGLVVVKVAMKPYTNMKLEPYVRALLRERTLLADVANALAYERVLETATNGYLVRQYLYSSLYDRMSTRPFLEEIEKKWLAFQLLCGLRDCHARNVFHGDIKSENILVTSWNWLYISDFSGSFKPAFLPEDNPADFSYYFDTSGRRTCYLAPERFIAAGEEANIQGTVNWAMDIFSAGCVIAELFLETPVFSLSQLYKYRKGEYDPDMALLRRIDDTDIRELVSHMIQREPEFRYSAEEYLKFWRRKAFPEYFYSFLHQYMALITDPSSGRKPITTEDIDLAEADERIERVYYDFDKIAYFLGYSTGSHSPSKDLSDLSLRGQVIPVHIDIPHRQHWASTSKDRPPDNGTFIFLALIVASIRSSARASSRVHACDLLLAFAERITDDAKLDRILPYVMTLASDRTDLVKATAIRTISQLMALVKVVSPANAYVFPEYILPRLQPVVQGPSVTLKPVVRMTYASCIATLAMTSSRFLDMTQALRADGSLPSIDPETEDGSSAESAYRLLYDVARNVLVEYFESHTRSLLTDDDSSVRRAFLGSVSSLCVFFGSTKAGEVILSHLNTYLNDRDWLLKCAFFETVVGVGTFLGSTGLEEFVLPLMVQALTDPEDFVVEKVLRSLASLAQLGAFQRSKVWELVDIAGRFTMHPNLWIREAAASFVASSTTFLSAADCYCIIAPLVRPYLRYSMKNFDEYELLDALQAPLPRPVFDMAVSWATKVSQGTFWQPIKQPRLSSFGVTTSSPSITSARDLGNDALSRIPKNEEDEQWLARLRGIGMTSADEWKLVALREYICRMAPLRPKEGAGNNAAHLNNVINLKHLDLTPQTIFFNEELRRHGTPPGSDAFHAPGRPQTIAEALVEASTTINDSRARQNRAVTDNTTAEHGPAILTPTTVADTNRSTRRPSQSEDDVTRRNAKGKLLADRNGRQRGIVLTAGTREDPPRSDGRTPIEGHPQDVQHHTIRHKASAVALMSRGETSKADAETGTTSANVLGKVEGPHPKVETPLSLHHGIVAKSGGDQNDPARYQNIHSYEGGDPSVLKLLQNLFQEQCPADVVEFGSTVTPVTRRQRIKRGSGEYRDSPWRPDGGLVALFGEHTAAINRVVIAPDHVFFVSGSDDGSVKIWDAARLERSIAYRSRQTHKHAVGAKVKSICFVENTHCVVSAASDGSIHVIRIEYNTSAGASRYGKLRILKTYQLENDQYAIWLEHFKQESQSILLVLTNTSHVLAVDLRTMTVLYTLSNPVQHGAPTCFCVDKKRTWLLLGTMHGILSLWDLRFRVRVKAWGLSGGTPIHRLTVYPFKGRGRWVCVAGGYSQGELTVWDVEKSHCREVYRTGGHREKTKNPERQYEPWQVDEEKREGVLARFATSLEANEFGSAYRGIRAFALGADTLEDGRESRNGFLLTAGTDRKVRFWDLSKVEASFVVSGLDLEESKPSFSSSHPTPTLVVHNERSPQNSAQLGDGSSSSGSPAKRVVTAAAAAARPPRSTMISLQQQQLLNSHLDSVTDVALLEWPYGMVVSADRSGMIYVFR